MEKLRMLVHICCAPDALYVMDLLKEKYEITGYFYNPNIHPREEYDLRLKEARRVARLVHFDLVEEVYDDSCWFRLTEKFKNDPEKATRCDICYAMRLKKTALKASQLGFSIFATTMSLSPWKKANVLNRIGRMFARKNKIQFLEADFKKKDGFKKSIELSHRHSLYRQNYCGCVYSQRKK